jgi:hypothetical protein
VGAAGPLRAVEAPADGEPVGAGDELTVGGTDGDVAAVGVAVGVALDCAVAGAEADAVAAGEVDSADDAGAAVAGGVTSLDTARPVRP